MALEISFEYSLQEFITTVLISIIVAHIMHK